MPNESTPLLARPEVRRFMGLEHLPEDILDEICGSNLRIARVVSVLVMAAAVALFAFQWLHAPAAGADAQTIQMIASAAIFGVAALCCAYSHASIRWDKPRRTTAHLILALFMLGSYAFGIVISSLDIAQGGTMAVFQITEVLGACIFVLNPFVSLGMIGLSFAAFAVVLAQLGALDPLTVGNLVCMMGVLVAVSAARYGERVNTSMDKATALRLSRTDGLTRLKNRVSLRTDFERLMGREVVVMMADIDDFKYFNDAYGHKTGDDILVGYANALRAGFDEGSIYRYGGDEFLIIMENHGEEEFLERTRRFTEAVRTLKPEGQDMRLTASAGYAIGTPRSDAELRAMMQMADKKLYEAKYLGKNCVLGSLYDPDTTVDDGGFDEGASTILRQSERDELTGLANMRHFREYGRTILGDPLAMARKPKFVYFNLANFKSYNERYGFDAGDELLRATADAIIQSFPNGKAARFAEDRFALLTFREEVESRIAQAHQAVHDHQRDISVELKAGICELDATTTDISMAYDRAKLACNSVKGRFDMDWRIYDDELAERSRTRQFVIGNFHEALQERRITVRYQPIHRAITGRLCGCEALARWNDPKLGMVSPAVFIPTLEEAHLIADLDQYVIKTVCADWREQTADGRETVPVSVNLSRTDFQLMDMVDVVERIVRDAGMPRQMLRIEVTESAVTEDDRAITEQLKRFRELGYQAWMDDFGAGESSLSELKDREFDVVKLDMRFLREFNRPRTREVLMSLVDMVKRLGMQTLVEGVETAEQLEFLQAIGCELVQGYHLGKPMRKEQFAMLLAEETILEPYARRGYYDAIGRVSLTASASFAPEAEEAGEAKDAHGQEGDEAAAPHTLPAAMEPEATERTAADAASEAMAPAHGDAASADAAADGPSVVGAFVPQESGMPLAIAEFDDAANTLELLSANEAFRRTAGALRLDSLDRLQDAFNDELANPASAMRQFVRNICLEGLPQVIDAMISGMHCVVKGRPISHFHNRHALLLSLEDSPFVTGVDDQTRADVALNYLCLLYDRVDLVNMETGDGEAIVVSKSRPVSAFRDDVDGRQAVIEFARANVLPEDQEEFLEYCRMDTLLKRTRRTELGYLTKAFRLVNETGSYVWQVLTLIPVETPDGWYAMACLRTANMDLLNRLNDPDAGVSATALWNAAVELVNAKVFWKDRERRFLGANRRFLDYYGLDSVTDLLGKTDEDMGWHVDPQPFAQDEAKVLHGGSIDSAVGTCIVHGQMRTIATNKMPLVNNGEVVGLIGYFVDVDEEQPLRSRVTERADVDSLTGVASAESLMSVLTHYEDSYKSSGADYALHYLDSDNIRIFNAQHGRAFGDRMLQETARVLDETFGRRNVVGRWRSDEFVILQQHPQRADEFARQLYDALGRITQIDGIPVSMEMSVGTALRSEAPGINDLVRLAEGRMRDSRTLRAIDGTAESPVSCMTLSDLIRRMKILGRYFDLVRLVDPSTFATRELDERGEMLSEPYCCFSIWGTPGRCKDCISAKTVATQSGHSKYEVLDDDVLFITTQYVEVDGVPYSLELATRLPGDTPLGQHGAAKLGAKLEEQRSEEALDELTGLFSRAYFDQMLAPLHAGQLALVKVDHFDEIEKAFTDEQSDDVLKQIARSIAGQIRPCDAVIRYRNDCFAVVAQLPCTDDEFVERITAAMDAVSKLDFGLATPLQASVSAGVVLREGPVRNLTDPAERALIKAQATGSQLVEG